MARELVALVSADDLVAAVRVHADRVHDLLRRSGCGPAESVEVSESYALALIDALVNAPETVGDMAGWWFARALELGRRLGGGIESSEVDDGSSASVLSGTTGESQVRGALGGLGRDERTAVLLRDGYDLPPQAVAVALGTGPERAAELVGAGRLNLVSSYDDRQVPSLAGHSGRTPADIGTLSALADGTLPPPQTVPQRRHLSSCTACEEVVEWMAKGRRLAAGLPIVAMPDEAREAMLERVAARAGAVLPSVDEVLIAVEEEHDLRPAVSPIVAVLAIVMALVLGVALAAITSSGRGGGADALVPTSPTLIPETPSFSVSATPTKRSATPRASRTAGPSATTSTVSVQPSSAAPTTTAPPPEVPGTITLSPASGPRGTDITVTGRDWTPGSQVVVQYRATLGSSSTTVTVGRSGRFTAVVTANGTLPGSYPVQAEGGGESASATFEQTT